MSAERMTREGCQGCRSVEPLHPSCWCAVWRRAPAVPCMDYKPVRVEPPPRKLTAQGRHTLALLLGMLGGFGFPIENPLERR